MVCAISGDIFFLLFFFYFNFCIEVPVNSVDPDQTPLVALSALALHFLHDTLKEVSGLKWLIQPPYVNIVKSILFLVAGFSPMNVLVEQLQTAFNITWDPPVATPSSPTSYVIHYKLTSDKQEHEVVLPASRRHFILSTWPHYGREYELGVSANFPTLKGSSSGPFIQRSSMWYCICQNVVL